MIPHYVIFLRAEAMDALRTIRGIQRRQLAAYIDSLATNPVSEGDYAMRDPSGRDIQIKILGTCAVTFWSDHAAKEIKILDIRGADKA
jgi:hypothetical protein